MAGARFGDLQRSPQHSARPVSLDSLRGTIVETHDAAWQTFLAESRAWCESKAAVGLAYKAVTLPNISCAPIELSNDLILNQKVSIISSERFNAFF